MPWRSPTATKVHERRVVLDVDEPQLVGFWAVNCRSTRSLLAGGPVFFPLGHCLFFLKRDHHSLPAQMRQTAGHSVCGPVHEPRRRISDSRTQDRQGGGPAACKGDRRHDQEAGRTLRPWLNVTLTMAGPQVTAILETITDPRGT
jgi:hypothetical protein